MRLQPPLGGSGTSESSVWALRDSQVEEQQLTICCDFQRGDATRVLSGVPFPWERQALIVILGLGKQLPKWLFRTKIRKTQVYMLQDWLDEV